MSRTLFAIGNSLKSICFGGVMKQQHRAKHIYGVKAQYNDEELSCKYESYFNRAEIDNWEVRKAMDDLYAMDLIPEPTVVVAALRACRRINDYALAVRWLEVIRFKSRANNKKIWPWMVEEIQATLDELGIETPEELNYDTPELYLPSVFR